jgi:hypothetical protein
MVYKMADREEDEPTASSDAMSTAETLAVSSNYKVLGEFDAADGAGVLGKNTANSGTPIGVEGSVPNATGGYGLSTPHDANVGGTLELTALNGGVTGNSLVTSLPGSGLTISSGSLAVELTQVGSGTGVLGSATDSGLEHRSLSGTDGLTVSESSGTINLGQASITTDTASTFEESDVTIANTYQTHIVNGAISLANAVQFGSSGTSFNRTAKQGIRIDATSDISALTLTTHYNNNNVSTVYLEDSSKNTIATKPSPGPGRTVTFDQSLSGGSTYYVAVDNDGSNYDYGNYSVPNMYPVSTDLFEISEGYNGYRSANGFTRVEAQGTDPPVGGSMEIEFADVTPVSRWESVAFQHDADGATVEVDVQTSDDGGSTWSNWSESPVSPGTDISSIPASNRVRFRVRLDRIDISNNPIVTRLTRQYRP